MAPFVGFTPLERPCMSSEHNPPSMMVLPPGTHTWECPSCGHKTVFVVAGVFMRSAVSP